MLTHRYEICGQEMEHVFEEKDLGVTFDSDMSFDEWLDQPRTTIERGRKTKFHRFQHVGYMLVF